MSVVLDTPDPLAILLAPPPNESPASRAERLQIEAEARRVSEQIDEDIRRERLEQRKWEKEKRTVKVLLLGQSESGKSTTIKNFQMAYAPNSFAQELSSWRAVVYLNLTRSVLTILDVLTKEASRLKQSPSSSSSLDAPQSQSSLVAMASSSSTEDGPEFKMTPVSSPHVSASELGLDEMPRSPSSPPLPPFPPELAEHVPRSRVVSSETSASQKFMLSQAHAALMARLLPPLLKVQDTLEASLGAPEPSPNSPYGGASTSAPSAKSPSPHEVNWRPNARKPKEFAITTRMGWRAALMKVKERISTSSTSSLNSVSSKKAGKRRKRDEMDVEEVREILCELGNDIQALWVDESVRALLLKRKVRMEERSGFFLDDISRITKLRYEPTSDDVVRARLRTMGVQEYRFISEKVEKENIAAGLLSYGSKKSSSSGDSVKRSGPLGMEPGREWIIYDVGGARSNRQAWLPYFTALNAIIFLAPISCFDERLAEDPRVNRLEDSLILWKTIVSSDVLRGVQLILFLNKCDILQKKIHRGVRVADYVSSYGDRPNDAKSVGKYLRQQFKELTMRHSPQQRQFFSFFTSVTDTKATAITVAAVREGIQRSNLRKVDLI